MIPMVKYFAHGVHMIRHHASVIPVSIIQCSKNETFNISKITRKTFCVAFAQLFIMYSMHATHSWHSLHSLFSRIMHPFILFQYQIPSFKSAENFKLKDFFFHLQEVKYEYWSNLCQVQELD